MNKDYFVWGGGLNDDIPTKTLRQRQYELLQSSGWGKNIDNIYVKDDCILYIAKGELYKEGLFNFEKAEQGHKVKIDKETGKHERELITLQGSTGGAKDFVIDCAIGENHILIQTMHGKVYAWGDNYYGQLGLGNCFVAKVFEPHQIKITEVKKIFAYKNNSFAIDIFNKLWVWGKSDFLGTNFKGNAFKPMTILSQYIIENFKINDDRIIVQVMEDSKQGKVFKKEDNEGETKGEKVTTTQARETFVRDKERQITGKVSNANNNLNSEPGQDNPEVDFIKSKKRENKVKDEANIDRANVLMMKVVKKLNEDITECFSKLSSEDKVFTDIRTKVLSDKMTIKGVGLEQIWNEISNILTQSTKSNKQVRNALSQDSNNISLGDTIEVFSYVLHSMTTGKVNEINVNKLMEHFSSYEKETTKIVSEIKLDDMIADETVNNFAKNIQTLLTYFIKYKKLEMLCHKMSAHQFLLKSFRFQNVMEALDFIIQKDDNVEKKLYLVEKSFESLRLLIQKVNVSLSGLEDIFGNLNKLNFQNTDVMVEKFMYKHIIESTLQIRDLWNLLLTHVESHKIAKEKENQMVRVLDAYKEMHSIQMYLNSLSLKTLFFNENKPEVKAKTDVSIKEIKSKVVHLITEVDGAINRLKSILKENYENDNKQIDNYSKELIIMYATSLLDNAYNKRVLFQLLYSIEKSKIK